MTMPKLQRVKVSSEAELRVWLAKNTELAEDVMIVTCNKTSPQKHVSRAQVLAALADTGWTSGRSYTLDGNLVGHVVSQTT